MSNKILMSVAEYNANMSPSTGILITNPTVQLSESEKDTIIAEQEKLIADLSKRDEWLSYLEAAGIDNTSAYEYAIKLRNDDNLHSEDDE
jgi:hypothetical protein